MENLKHKLYAVSLRCACGCTDEFSYIIDDWDMLLDYIKNYEIKISESLFYKGIVYELGYYEVIDGRFIYKEENLYLGFNRLYIEGEKIIKFIMGGNSHEKKSSNSINASG